MPDSLLSLRDRKSLSFVNGWRASEQLKKRKTYCHLCFLVEVGQPSYHLGGVVAAARRRGSRLGGNDASTRDPQGTSKQPVSVRWELTTVPLVKKGVWRSCCSLTCSLVYSSCSCLLSKMANKLKIQVKTYNFVIKGAGCCWFGCQRGACASWGFRSG